MNKPIPQTALLALLLFSTFLLEAQSFKKGYKAYTKSKDNVAAAAIFEKHLDDKYGAAARFYLTKIQLNEMPALGEILAIDSMLNKSAELLAALPPKTAKKQNKKFKINARIIENGRKTAQQKAVAYVKAKNSVAVLDSLLDGLPKPLPAIAPEIDSLHVRIVNNNLESKDYETLTSILNRHIKYVSPDNYGKSRAINDRIWRVFQAEYPLCKIDKFAADHPLSFVARDCWRAEIVDLICKENVAELLDFHARVQWTALEFSVINTITDLNRKGKSGTLTPEQTARLKDLRQVNALFDLLGSDSDTTLTRTKVEAYVTKYAPRFSAYLIMQTAVQYFLERRAFSSTVQMLQTVRPYFTDSLPAACNSNFDFQTRAKPYIDGMLPILKKPEEMIAQNPLEPVNTVEGDESSPVLSQDGNTLYFAASGRLDEKDPNAGQEVFTAKKENGKWSKPSLVAALSGKGNQSPLSLTADGNQLLLLINGRLHIAKRNKQGAWGKPEALPVSGLAATGRAVFSADGKAIILEGAEDAGGALSGPDMDLYVTVRDEKGKWSTPAGLGAFINTDKQEGNPYLHADGKTLYYTSTGYPGLGKSDIFVAYRTGADWAKWSRPINLGKEINNTYSHKGFGHVAVDGALAYYANYLRDGEKGDIWQTTLPSDALPQKIARIQGLLLTSKGNPVAERPIEFSWPEDSSGVHKQVVKTDKSGAFSFTAPPDETITLRAAYDDFLDIAGKTYSLGTYNRSVTLRDTFRLRHISDIDTFNLQNARFDYNSAVLRPESFEELQRLYDIATKAGINLLFTGHTDNTGSDERNDKLSFDRASAVREYMITTLKFPSDRIQVGGKGSHEPRCAEDTEACRQLNRRVEVMILRVKKG